MRNLKQLLIWLKRFRYRCGYGVHSPFAFDFITNVIYEKTPYYAYREIEGDCYDDQGVLMRKESQHSKKINRLLFRLVNRVQPKYIIHVGRKGFTSFYLRKAKSTAEYFSLFSQNMADLPLLQEIDFLYIDCPEDTAFIENIFEYGVIRATSHSMIVMHGIYHSKAMRAFWKRVVADERVGITFDLYDLGILFFDHTKIKQHYIVNF